ncbi:MULTISPECIES: carbohydrate porin [Dyella]|uniref:Carbohydrate porin n=2 Tax=Dyella TaxID=231454 RepID=A0A4R0Z295_9GAMM|nr:MULTISPECIES: carbohydrate porin [Dyella]TBR38851.1 carbohydrate porin [Dyella terrae]TCI13558.1 carbohydrate porin [Dyella soli]
MRSKLLAVAIAAGLGVVSFHVAAEPAQAKKVAKPAAQAESSKNAEIEALKAQLAELQAKVAQLEERTDAQSDINVSTGQNVEAVQKAQAASDKKVSSVEKFVNNTKISGTMFFDLTNANHKEHTANGMQEKDGHGSVNGVGYDVKRFYLSVDHTFDDVWSANLTTDFNYQSTLSQTSLFVKKAYVQGKFDPLFTVRFGAADMPWIPFVEKWYGYRFLENTITDRSIDGGRGTVGVAPQGVGSFGNSSDWGLHALGATAGDNAINYQLSVVNGRGFRNPSRSQSVDVEGRFGYQPIEQMVIAVGGYSGKRGNDVQNGAPTQNATRGDLLVAYRDKTFGVGAEYFNAKNWDDVLKNNVPTAVVNRDKAEGYSVFGDWSFAPQWALFARYDHVEYKYWANTGPHNELKDTYYNAGVSYDVLKNFKLAFAYKYDKMEGPTVNFPYKTNEIGFWGLLTY